MPKIGKSTKIWEPANIYESAIIGDNCSVGMYSEIGEEVVIGDNCRIGFGSFIPKGIWVEDNVFIGPRVVFCNDKYPRVGKPWKCSHTLVQQGASIGANCTILPGVVINKNAMVGAGSVVTKDIPEGETWFGVPARKQPSE